MEHKDNILFRRSGTSLNPAIGLFYFLQCQDWLHQQNNPVLIMLAHFVILNC
jgi:hypothetical protein